MSGVVLPFPLHTYPYGVRRDSFTFPPLPPASIYPRFLNFDLVVVGGGKGLQPGSTSLGMPHTCLQLRSVVTPYGSLD
jgi:hypothetical protein